MRLLRMIVLMSAWNIWYRNRTMWVPFLNHIIRFFALELKSHSSENHGFELSCSRKSPLMVTHHRNITFAISLAIKNSQVQSFRCLCTTQSYWVRISPLKSWKEVSRLSTLKKMSSSNAKPFAELLLLKMGCFSLRRHF